MRTNTEDGKWPVILVVAGEHEPSGLIIEIARNREYREWRINFYYDVVETQKQAVKRVKQLAEKGREVIGVIFDETTAPDNYDDIVGLEDLQWEKVKNGEVTAFNRKFLGKQWDVATSELLEQISDHENLFENQ
jgi:hypothetical protein